MPMNDYLLNAKISLLEQKLNLKESVGLTLMTSPIKNIGITFLS